MNVKTVKLESGSHEPNEGKGCLMESEIKELVEDYKIEPLVPSYKPFWTATMSKARIPDEVARRFHEAYERLAPSFSYETRKESAVPWSEVPENNKALMRAVCAEVDDYLRAEWEREAKARLSDLIHPEPNELGSFYNRAIDDCLAAITGPEQEQGE